jgi:hypothetical protein
MSKITLNAVPIDTYVDVDVDVNDVLAEIDDDELLKYVIEEFSKETIIEKLNDHHGYGTTKTSDEEIVDYIISEYHRRPFTNINFKKLFEGLGIPN